MFDTKYSNIRNQKRVLYTSFFARCISPWNAIPHEVKNLNSASSFSSGLNKHLWADITDNSDVIFPLPQYIADIEPD